MEEIKYYLLCYVIPIVIACFIFIRMFGLNKAKCKAFICSLVCRYIHGKVCDKEKALLFEQLKDHKNSLKTNSKFTILEIGVGSGMNFKFFPSECDVTCLDPNPYNEKYVIDSLRKANNNIRLVKFIEGYAENMLDVPSDSFDAVVCTFTMCSIKGLNDAIEEIRRVLKPGGKFFFLEHVAAHKGSHLRSLQDKFQRIWPYIAKDTHINRETWKFLDNSSFKDVQYHLFTAKFFLAFLAKPCIHCNPYDSVNYILLECPFLIHLRQTLLPPQPNITNTLYSSAEQLKRTVHYISLAQELIAQQQKAGQKKK